MKKSKQKIYTQNVAFATLQEKRAALLLAEKEAGKRGFSKFVRRLISNFTRKDNHENQ